jgi:hypothetical protein
MATQASGRAITRADVIVQLAQDVATAEAVSALEVQGIRAILLKGAAIAARLYDNPIERSYGDGDLLVDPARYEEAAGVLKGLGYVDALGDVREAHIYHGRSFCRRASTIDLHWRLPATSDGALTWATLGAGTRRLTVGGREIEVLGDAALALVISCHVVHHGPAEKPRQDLDRALRRFDRDVWVRTAQIAGELDVQEFLAAGLRENADGRRVARELGLPTRTTAEINSLLTGRNPASDGFIRLGKVTSLRELVILLAGELVPSPAFMRQGWSFARRGPVALALTYLYRLFWLAINAPMAYRSWRSAARRAEPTAPTRPAA